MATPVHHCPGTRIHTSGEAPRWYQRLHIGQFRFSTEYYPPLLCPCSPLARISSRYCVGCVVRRGAPPRERLSPLSLCGFGDLDEGPWEVYPFGELPSGNWPKFYGRQLGL